ncbi:MAG: hypothetical protein IJV67_06320 [Clostridia bacterium]|nr:hypothetical protein [Clostridia bacterium]
MKPLEIYNLRPSCGGLVAQLANGKELEEAALFGSKAASIACTKKGAQPSIPTYEEVVRY